jgi:hypothetical protein
LNLTQVAEKIVLYFEPTAQLGIAANIAYIESLLKELVEEAYNNGKNNAHRHMIANGP